MSAPPIVAILPAASPCRQAILDAVRAAGAVVVDVSLVGSADASMADSPGEGSPIAGSPLAEGVLIVDRSELDVRAPADVPAIYIDPAERPDLPDAFDVLLPEEIPRRLPRAIVALARSRAAAARLRMEEETIDALNGIGRALSARTDRDALLEEILRQSRRLLAADAGSIYLLEGGVLRFSATQNDSVPFRRSAASLPVESSSIAGYVARSGRVVNLADVRNIPAGSPFQFNPMFDVESGYRTRSMLLAPFVGRDGDVLGVLALINRRGDGGLPFSARDEALLRSVASQASVALENSRLYGEIQALFDGFVEASVKAIEDRDPATGGHSHRVAALTQRLALAVGTSTAPGLEGVVFSAQELTELRYAALLHDFGKVGVREEILLKASRLHPWELAQLELRLHAAALRAVLEARQEVRSSVAALEQDLAWLRRLNDPKMQVGVAEKTRLQEIARRWQLGAGSRELSRLTIPHGSLDEHERADMEQHVAFTWRFLAAIPWTGNLRRVPEIAAAHHEKLDGTGYPFGLRGDNVPIGAQLMAIADIWDAVTARDRPYREGVRADLAVDLLQRQAADGELNRAAVALFVGERLWT